MKKIAVALLMAGGLAAAGQASAHGPDGGAVVGALIGGAVLGAVVSSALNPAPVYQPAPVYAGPPPGYCYDPYRRAYVPCAVPAPVPYGYVEPGPRPEW